MSLTVLWVIFAVMVLCMMALDLGVFHRRAHEVKTKEALVWSGVWIALALIFGGLVYSSLGSETGLNYLSGYIIELSLSVDNLFVFIMIFSYFCIKREYQHKVLFWGILGAIIMRAVFIAAGITLIENLSWVLYIFGVFLIYTGIKMVKDQNKEIHPDKNPLVNFVCRILPMTNKLHGDHFFIKENGRKLATPLILVLVSIEAMDLVFAVDSIPAVMAITLDPFIIFTSNIFAVMGLRAMYMALSGVIQKLHYLHYGLAAILAFLGIKMLISDFFHMPVTASLGVVAVILAISIAASLLKPPKEIKPVEMPHPACPVDEGDK
ncbi:MULTISPECIES: TerC family protein [Dehalococcoides]|uniref:TerC family protein n=1 Tax=Dehalococcoides TaxID=61434 RepID=UPI0001BDD13A|nr:MULTISPECIES: TerC family protein [Dehalococcoides]AGG05819.1 tellurium ion resistance (TerC) family protein [Dehalococcoides mccartyi DCMB5]AGG07234.1 tellurium ion resistance (TerC) family protein [Dehalococcoides mccartyi BTF08]AQU05335.1 tellurium resistance protein TerC [Dehalococcoides mccartyi]AQU06788.1 tellurium resistance protein TerC [Dehalococcoides mccartyi]AQW61884.1 tellurium resistance protein TerC [Dehalococcoides mccartyi]